MVNESESRRGVLPASLRPDARETAGRLACQASIAMVSGVTEFFTLACSDTVSIPLTD
jgi:hypothetical protein